MGEDRRRPILGLGSAAVMDYSARHDGPALDAIVYEYELELPKFHAFIESPAAKKLFRALEPAVRTYLALESTATTDFAELELDKYFLRWRAVYGSPVRSTAFVRSASQPSRLGIRD